MDKTTLSIVVIVLSMDNPILHTPMESLPWVDYAQCCVSLRVALQAEHTSLKYTVLS